MKKRHVFSCTVEILLFLPYLLKIPHTSSLHRRFDSAFLESVQTQDKSLKATGKTNTVEIKAIKHKAVETALSVCDGSHVG